MFRWIALLLLISVQLSAEESCRNFEDGFVSGEKKLKSCSAQAKGSCFSEEQESARWPFRINSSTAKNVVICAHGLGDSPYYFKDVSKCMASRQTEVWGIRLAGHDDSISGSHLSRSSWEKWSRQMCCAMDRARAEGKEPILCGFSTGGTVALYHAISQECGRPAGVILFSAAIDHHSWWTQRIAMTDWSETVGSWNLPVVSFGLREKACSRYDNIYTAGVHSLNEGIRALKRQARRVDVPVLSYFSTDDHIVSVKRGISYLRENFSRPTVLAMGKKRRSEFGLPEDPELDRLSFSKKLHHSAIFEDPGCSPEKEKHPYFALLCSRLSRFVKELQGSSL